MLKYYLFLNDYEKCKFDNIKSIKNDSKCFDISDLKYFPLPSLKENRKLFKNLKYSQRQ